MTRLKDEAEEGSTSQTGGETIETRIETTGGRIAPTTTREVIGTGRKRKENLIVGFNDRRTRS